MIGVVDYGLGNIRAFKNVYDQLSVPVTITSNYHELKGVSRIILPGVGGFDDAIERLERSGMRPALEEMVFEKGVPVLGVCVGMQLLGHSSEEGVREGLGWIPGRVRRFSQVSKGLPLNIPHMGWNDLRIVTSCGLFDGLESGARFYFLHSYFFESKSDDVVLAVTDYGGEFACAIRSGNVFGVQFHPEKSHAWGLRLLNNFAAAAL